MFICNTITYTALKERGRFGHVVFHDMFTYGTDIATSHNVYIFKLQLRLRCLYIGTKGVFVLSDEKSIVTNVPYD
jgi:hypothetical protein